MNILVALLVFPVVLGVKQLCPGGTASCPDTSTCCQLLDKGYGCCPIQDAVCCDDHIHCCPAKTKCSAGMCVELENTNKSIQAIKTNDVVCPGGEATCPDQTTCCKSSPGQVPKYGCCPMPNAVCCSDGFHCCPNGTTCEVAEGKCLGDGYVTEMYRKKSIRPHLSQNGMALIRESLKQVNSVVCPGSGFQCPDSYTCCMTQSGDWGCCPFPKAQCCVDKIHCCPENMHCDATSQYCSQGMVNTTSLRKVLAEKVLQVAANDVCPDKTKCDSSSTCCEILGGKFGCCPYVNATCCTDHLHCCPMGSLCDVEHNRCLFSESWMSNVLHAIFQKL